MLNSAINHWGGKGEERGQATFCSIPSRRPTEMKTLQDDTYREVKISALNRLVCRVHWLLFDQIVYVF